MTKTPQPHWKQHVAAQTAAEEYVKAVLDIFGQKMDRGTFLHVVAKVRRAAEPHKGLPNA